MSSFASGSRCRGFTLLEVMIAIVVLAIGVLGLAALQFNSLRSNNQSYERSQAQAFAYEIADQMRANRASAAQFALAFAATPGVPTDCEAGPCTPNQIAAFELSEWHTRLSNTLPAGDASIVCSVAPCVANSMFTVSVLWDEPRTNPTAAGRDDCSEPLGSATKLACVQVSFTP